MQRTVVITGANRGIGLELCRQLRGRGDHVIAACRKPSGALDSLDCQVVVGVDVTTDEGIGALVAGVGHRSLDWLINNAGVLTRETLDDLNLDAIRLQFEVNALGPLRVTAALRGALKPGSKVGIVTSRMGSIADNTSGSRYGYRMSKVAVNMAGRSLAQDLRPDGVAVRLLHPGFVRTGMTGGVGNLEASEAAAGLIARMDELTLESTGQFLHQSGQELPW